MDGEDALGDGAVGDVEDALGDVQGALGRGQDALWAGQAALGPKGPCVVPTRTPQTPGGAPSPNTSPRSLPGPAPYP